MSLETYGRYQLLKKLATGGMAQIYLARQLGPEGFEKLLVVKRILPHLAENEDFITMFLDEARIAARLNHPNIVQIFDLGAQDDSYFIAMEFIHGEDVRRVWKHSEKMGRPIPLALICRIIIEASAGLDYAHKKPDASGRPLNIVHRDISPQNILVSFEGGVKVVDFGIAKAADQATVTKSGVLKGKYSYMSPEQAAGQSIDCRTDIFALGVVLYELLTGTRLFKRGTDIQTLNAVTECKLQPPSAVNDRVPADLDVIVMRALTKDRADRFPEARQLGAALENWLLTNGLPSGSAALAEFMQDIYAERLEREREEGRLLVETAEHSRGEEPLADREKATPSLDGLRRQTRSMRSSQSQPLSQLKPRRELEATAAERPSSSRSQSSSRRVVERSVAQAPLPARPVPVVSHPTEASMPTQGTGARRSALLPLVALGLLVLVGLAAWSFFAERPAGFSLETDPPGASVSRAGAQLCTTPCDVTDLVAGELTLTIEKSGFRPERRSLQLKAGVHEAMAQVRLASLVVEPPQVKTVAALSTVRIESDPTGAEVQLNGVPAGTAPASKAFAPGAVVDVHLELAGYAPLVESFTVGSEPEDLHQYALKALSKSPAKQPVVKNTTLVPEVKAPLAAGRGTVRFVVKPWAMVECPQLRFKDTTPFADQAFPAGDYACTFTNPDHPAQTKSFRVEPNATTKVAVSFLQD